jgi:hypothetical protein
VLLAMPRSRWLRLDARVLTIEPDREWAYATAGDETPTAVVWVERGIGIDVFLARMKREG